MMPGSALDRFFLPEAEDRARLPVALLTGCLGSGKTTLVNGLLRDERMADTAVAVNEFGAVPVDHHLIDHGADRTVVLANGCLCCTVSGDLEDAVMRVFTRRAEGELPRFARLVVEPSGLADPAPIAQAILRNPGMSRALRLDGIMAVVDALFAGRQLAEEVAAKQVMLADRIVLTKTDLAAPAAVARLRARLAELNPVAPVLDVRHGQVDPAALFTPHFLDPTGPAPPTLFRTLRMATVADGAHVAETRATVLLADAPVEWAALDAWLRRKRIAFADRLLREGGATVVGEVYHPLFTTDMSSPIVRAQASRADVVALMNVGGDLVNALKQAGEFGLSQAGQKLAGFWMTVTDVHAVGPAGAGGIYFAEAFYWDQDDTARAWSRRFHERVRAMPNSYQAGIYGAVTHYLKAVRAAGTAEPAAVMAKMRELPVEDFMTRRGTVREDGRVIRDIQVLQAKTQAESKGEWDLARVVATIPGDQAFRPLSQSDCLLVRK